MAERKKNTADINNTIKAYQALNESLKEQEDMAKATRDFDKERAIQAERLSNTQQMINELKKRSNELGADGRKLLADSNKELLNEKSNIEKSNKQREKSVSLQRELNGLIKQGWNFLQQSDKIIRSTNLNLGLAGIKAEMMRTSFEQSANYVASLGGSIEDVQSVMQGFADETGRARVLSAQMVKDITDIGKGTGLGVEQATKLGAQFEFMGLNAKSTMDYIQGVVDTSERMGVNTTKVLKNISDNFKRLNTYTFQQGVKGFAQMAQYAEQLQIDMNQALNAAEISRTLEGAISLAANLQVMGGEFAKTDPFQMLFLSRNDPAKFTEKISEMTRGVVTFRKTANGTFEKFISPADRDRLSSVAKSLGISVEEITKIAERRADMDKMAGKLEGMGLSVREKELIQGAAVFNSQSGKFEVMLAGKMRDITTLTSVQAKSFEREQKTLHDRAIEAQTFDEAFKATINQLKVSLLPMLQGINKILQLAQPLFKGIGKLGEGSGGWIKAAGLLISGAFIWKGMLMPLLLRLEGATIGKTASFFGGKKMASSMSMGRGGNIGQSLSEGAKGAATKGGGLAGLGKGAGVGIAMVGAGAGISLAAKGISELADSMSKLDKTQVAALPKVILSLAAAIGAFIIPLAILGITAKVTSGGLAALGLVALGVGAGIGIAAAGIGVMGEGLSKLVDSSKGAGPGLYAVAGGIGAIVGATSAGILALPGALTLAGALTTMAVSAPALVSVGNSIEKIKTSLSGSREDFVAIKEVVDSISNVKAKGAGIFADLANVLKKPLQVEFKEKEISMVARISITMDGKKVYDALPMEKVPVTIQNLKTMGSK